MQAKANSLVFKSLIGVNIFTPVTVAITLCAVLSFASSQIPAFFSASSSVILRNLPPEPRGPTTVTVDSKDNVYVSSYGSKPIQKFDSKGKLLGVINNPVTNFTGFTIDARDNLFFADGKQAKVYICDTQGTVIRTLNLSQLNNQYETVQAIAVNSQGNFYISSSYGGITKFDASGQLLRQWNQVPGPFALTVDRQDNLYLTYNDEISQVDKFDAQDNLVTSYGNSGNKQEELRNPLAVAIDTRGYIYIADYYNNRILILDNGGKMIDEWSKAGGLDLKRPTGVALDKQGNVYVADYGNARMVKFHGSGVYLLEWRDEDWKPVEGTDFPSLITMSLGVLMIVFLVIAGIIKMIKPKNF